MFTKHAKAIESLGFPALAGVLLPWIENLLELGLILAPWRAGLVPGASVIGVIALVGHYLIFGKAPVAKIQRNLMVSLTVFGLMLLTCFTFMHTIDQTWFPDGAALVAVWWVWKAAFILMTCSLAIFLSCHALINSDWEAQEETPSDADGTKDQSNTENPGQ